MAARPCCPTSGVVIVLRRALFAAMALAAAAALVWLLARALAPGGWTTLKLLNLLCFLGIAPWLGLCAGNALPGFIIALLARDPARYVLPADIDPAGGPITLTTAILVTLRDEPMDLVLPPLRRLLDGLDRAGCGRHFVLCLLSDTRDAAAEAPAVAVFRARDPLPARIRYRRRPGNAGFKAGNVMDFLDHHAGGCDVAVMLDADSEMTAAAVLRLVRLLQAAPSVGLVQHLTVGCPAEAAFPRLFQFGMRAGMRIWAIGQAWWQGDAGPYWGHNAAFRIAPFRAHCRLQPLPDGTAILSHDQVEAARLRAAGWGVWMWAGEDGSFEHNPPALPEFLARDARWQAGNLQYRHLLATPGLRAMGRWQLVQAMLLFTGAPLGVAMLALTSLLVASGGGAAVPGHRIAALALAWPLTLYAPKLLGYAQVLLSASERARYGGGPRFAVGALTEMAFSLLLDPPASVSRTLTLLRLLGGRSAGWAPQNRRHRGVSWTEAATAYWPHTLFGAAAFGALAAGAWGAALWALPFAGGLLTAIPFSVLTAHPRVSAWLRRHRVAATPEERGPHDARPARYFARRGDGHDIG
jgi:membrane glycosyltransferase